MCRLLAVTLLLMGLTLGQATALPVTSGTSNPTIVVGIIATLSGPGAMAGQDAVDGFTTALRHLGGRFANQEVRVVVVDDKGSPDTAQQVSRKMLEREKVNFILTSVSQSSMAAIAKPLLAERAFIINLEPVPMQFYGSECSPWVFHLVTPPDAIHEAAGVHFTTEKMRRIVVIGPDAPSTDLAVAALKRTWSGEVAAVIKPRHGATTYGDEIARLRQLGPDAVYTVLTGGMGLAFVRAYAAAGLKADIQLLGAGGGFERPALPAMNELGLDVLNVAPWSPDLDIPLNKRLITDFELEYGRPVTSWVAAGYDAGQFLEAVMRATNGRTGDPDATRNAMRRAEFTSVRGPFRFDPNHVPSVSLYLRRVVRDAKGRFTDEIRAPLIKDWHNREMAACPMRWTEEAKPGAPTAAPKPMGNTAPPPKPPPR
ncbi:ABC-type branched-chain amino acid transport systems, periplasmic component [Candidatus Terasakiella magnetica]|nr:ABC-type branched-chain amino acid transport systems, periplasmic component [Candidatus Terasakiella magnetica]